MALSFPNLPVWLWGNANQASSSSAPAPPPPPPLPPSSYPDSSCAFPLDMDTAASGRAYYAGRGGSTASFANPIPAASAAERPSVNLTTRRPHGNRRHATKHRRRGHTVDLEFDVVVVASAEAGCCFSASDSEDSDWSVGWFEPHAPDFCSDGEPENSFAVLVPCYGSTAPDTVGGNSRVGGIIQEESSKSQLWAGVLSAIAKDSQAEVNQYIQQWLSSLQNYSL